MYNHSFNLALALTYIAQKSRLESVTHEHHSDRSSEKKRNSIKRDDYELTTKSENCESQMYRDGY